MNYLVRLKQEVVNLKNKISDRIGMEREVQAKSHMIAMMKDREKKEIEKKDREIEKLKKTIKTQNEVFLMEQRRWQTGVAESWIVNK